MKKTVLVLAAALLAAGAASGEWVGLDVPAGDGTNAAAVAVGVGLKPEWVWCGDAATVEWSHGTNTWSREFSAGLQAFHGGTNLPAVWLRGDTVEVTSAGAVTVWGER